jgi:hypothetical protein
LRALLLAGRAPWLAFFSPRCGLAIRAAPFLEKWIEWVGRSPATRAGAKALFS